MDAACYTSGAGSKGGRTVVHPLLHCSIGLEICGALVTYQNKACAVVTDAKVMPRCSCGFCVL